MFSQGLIFVAATDYENIFKFLDLRYTAIYSSKTAVYTGTCTLPVPSYNIFPSPGVHFFSDRPSSAGVSTGPPPSLSRSLFGTSLSPQDGL